MPRETEPMDPSSCARSGRVGGTQGLVRGGARRQDLASIARFTGWSPGPDGQVGDALSGGSVAGEPALLVGGWSADGAFFDSGAAWPLELGD